jgi:excisionase family DNA binding protein
MIGRYLLVEDIAARMGIAKRTVHELTRTRRIPFRRLPFGRRCLFEESWLEAWADGAELEVVELEGNGLIVRPKASA